MNAPIAHSAEKLKRKHPAHGILYVDGQPTVIFDTVCTKDRKRWLAHAEVHEMLNAVWQEADAWLMGRYVIMPDHIHLFAAATESEIDYENWVKYWKSQFSKRHKTPGHRWLTDHWDTRMRNEEQYEEKWQYVLNNPSDTRWNSMPTIGPSREKFINCDGVDRHGDKVNVGAICNFKRVARRLGGRGSRRAVCHYGINSTIAAQRELRPPSPTKQHNSAPRELKW